MLDWMISVGGQKIQSEKQIRLKGQCSIGPLIKRYTVKALCSGFSAGILKLDRIEPAGDEASSNQPLVQPSLEKFPQGLHQTEMEESLLTTLVSNGCVDLRGRIADKQTTGGWKATPFIIVNEVAERLAFFATSVNMVAYLVTEMHQSIPKAATHVTDWIGAAYVLTLLGAFCADAYLGRFKTIIIFSCIYTVGMTLMTVSASIDSLRPPQCKVRPCPEATDGQTGFLYVALALIALGTGGIKPCVSSFGADQFDEADEKEVPKKYAFFDWFFFAINMGAILGLTVFVYIQQQKGWIWGFGLPTAAMAFSIIILVAGIRYYRFQKPMGSPFTRFAQVMVASVRNHLNGVQVRHQTELYEVNTKESDIKGAQKLSHTIQYGFLDKAAVVTDPDADTSDRWRVCTVTQVEEFKSFIRILPVWASTIAFSVIYAQLSTFFISQATIMDRKLGSNFTIPAGSVPIFCTLNALILVPIYEKVIVPVLRKHTGLTRGITSLQRIGVGLFLSIFSLVSAALVEKKRRDSPNPSAMSLFWLFPQIFLLGSAEVFIYVGQLEFFYDEATDGARSISSAVFLSEVGIGSWLSTALVTIIEKATGGEKNGWLRNDLNKSRLDYFYWVLSVINSVNFLVYLWVACIYKGRGVGVGSVRDESVVGDCDGDSDGGRRADKDQFQRRIEPVGDELFDQSFMQPSLEKFPQEELHQTTMEESLSTTLVSNDLVDIRGRIADKRTTGGWKAAPFIIVNEVAERLAFFAVAVNMVAYLVFQMHQSLPDAATHVTDWIGAAYVLTLLGAFCADAYLGRFKTIIIFSCIYAVGMVLLTLSASIDSLRPPECKARPCPQATDGQTGFLYGALALIALGTGGIKPCVSSFGADQFDEADEKEVPKKYAFFNWFFFAINIGALLGITVLVYIQEKKGWAWGFGLPTGAMVISLIVLVAGIRFYRFQKPMGSPFTRFVQVMVASVRNHLNGVQVPRQTELYEVNTKESAIKGAQKLSHTLQYSFLDKAAVVTDREVDTRNRWRLCTVTQVEECKSFIRILPVWASTIALAISFAQLSTFFISQANIMDRKLGSDFEIPAGSIPVFSAVNALILVPTYEKFIVPFLRKRTGHRRGITSLQRSAEVFTYVGQLEFFYDEATDGTRSISSAMFLSEIGIGSWLSTAIVKIVEKATGGQEKGWLRNSLNKSRLDYFYWVLTVINAVNLVVYLWIAVLYKGRIGAIGSLRNESVAEMGDGGLVGKENDEGEF
ncbi:unnamed protein product [Dovyalis caffra]|uniref:NPF family transporter n=1 Tax=Dovyalis caffra TaxID=77055 RepID=A0AAV1S735_9ROSI|nr:unnamed protein product [Dovyalis caffra]